jgi:hypothetical protein
MYLIIRNNNQITGTISEQPAVVSPDTIYQYISDENLYLIGSKNHYFDFSTMQYELLSALMIEKNNELHMQLKNNNKNKKFLNITDWQILRHIRQIALNIETSLTQEEYLELEQQRSDAAANIT